MRKLTVKFLVVTPKGDTLKATPQSITLPRAHALELAHFMFENDLFALDKAWFDKLPLPDRALIRA